MKTRRVSVAEGKRSLTALLREADETDTAVLIYRRDRLAGVLVPPRAYERLTRTACFSEAVRLSEELAHLEINAADLAREARDELAGGS